MTQVNAALVSPRPQSLQGDLSQLGPVADASLKDFRLPATTKINLDRVQKIAKHILNLLDPERRQRFSVPFFQVDLRNVRTDEITSKIRDALRKAGELGKQAGEDPTIAVQAVLYGVGHHIGYFKQKNWEIKYLDPIRTELDESVFQAFDAGHKAGQTERSTRDETNGFDADQLRRTRFD